MNYPYKIYGIFVINILLTIKDYYNLIIYEI
jgi:hypothetical protein